MNLLEINNLCKTFKQNQYEVKAVNNISLNVKKGDIVSIVGESGCGKSTFARCIVKACEVTSGDINYLSKDGKVYNLHSISKKDMKSIRKEIQMIFQDPFSSLDPRMTVYDILCEPLKANYKLTKKKLEEKVIDIAKKVGLNPSYLKRYPHAFSGGQRQRIGIARALILEPSLVVCDEAVSALDVSIQAQIINLLKDLQKSLGLTYIFISHDLSVVEYISDKVVVMYLGEMMEYAVTEELYNNTLHPYTEALLSSIPKPVVDIDDKRIVLQGEIANPLSPPKGCAFHKRCLYCIDICKNEKPNLKEVKEGHFVACHKEM